MKQAPHTPAGHQPPAPPSPRPGNTGDVFAQRIEAAGNSFPKLFRHIRGQDKFACFAARCLEMAMSTLDKCGPIRFNAGSTPARPLLACPNVAGFSFPGAPR